MTQAARSLEQIAADLNDTLEKLGIAERERSRREAELNEAIARLRQAAEPDLSRLQREQQTLTDELMRLALPHFDHLAQAGTRTIKLSSGTIALRDNPEKLEFIGSEEDVVAELRKRHQLNQFTRVKRTPDKTLLKKARVLLKQLKTVRVVRTTSLVIKPAKTQGPDIVIDLAPHIVTLPQEE